MHACMQASKQASTPLNFFLFFTNYISHATTPPLTLLTTSSLTSTRIPIHPSIFHLPSSQILPSLPQSLTQHTRALPTLLPRTLLHRVTPHPPHPLSHPAKLPHPSSPSPNISNSQACENAQPSFSSQCTVSTHPIALHPPPSEPMKGTGR